MKKKNINLDFIRSLAVFCVLSVHFFLHSGFYENIIAGPKMYLAVVLRTCFMICVPLFLLLSGFLMNKKTVSKKYYFALTKVVIPYVFSTLCIAVYRVIIGDSYTIPSFALDVASFQYYSWYIEMYIGLYLIIPFLNLIYNNIESKKQKQFLLVVCILVTIAPTFFNAFDKVIFPDWWQSFYPITYYFMGTYIAEYKEEFRINVKMNLLLIVISVFFTSGFCYFRSYNNVFNWGIWCTAGGFTNLLNAPLIFIFMLRISMSFFTKWVVSMIQLISKVSLPLYLVSHIFDSLWYPVLNTNVAMGERLYYYPLSIVITFSGSFVLAWVVEKVSTAVYARTSKLFERYI